MNSIDQPTSNNKGYELESDTNIYIWLIIFVISIAGICLCSRRRNE